MDAKFDVFAGGLREIPEYKPGSGSGGVEYTGENGISVNNDDRIISITIQGVNGVYVEQGQFFTIIGINLGDGIVRNDSNSLTLSYASTEEATAGEDVYKVITPLTAKAIADKTLSKAKTYTDTAVESVAGSGEYITNDTDDILNATVEYGKHYIYTQPVIGVEIIEGDLSLNPHKEATIRFTAAETTTLEGWCYVDLPSIQWVGGTPEIELGKSYIISIKDGLGVCCEVSE